MGNKTNLRDQRLKALATILTWEGELSNKRIRELFGLQNVQANRLTAEFRAAYEYLISEDEARRVITLNHDGLKKSHIEDYIKLLYEIEGETPAAVEDVRTDLAPVDPLIFAVIRNACLTGTGADIKYASMMNPEGTERTILPHTIVRAGRRWHIRAWCCLRNDYRDFAFGRIRTATESKIKPIDLERDISWDTIIDIKIAAHRGLDAKQARVIMDESLEGLTEKVIQSRACLASYLIQDIRVSIDPVKQIPPEYQLEVTNMDELSNWLWLSWHN